MMDVRLRMFNAVRQGLISAAINIDSTLDGKLLDVFVQDDGSVNVVEVGMYSNVLKIEPGAVIAFLNDVQEFKLIAHLFEHVLDVEEEPTTLDARVQLGEDVRAVLFSHVSAADEGEDVFLQYQDDGSILVFNQDNVLLEEFSVRFVKEILDSDDRTNKFVGQ